MSDATRIAAMQLLSAAKLALAASMHSRSRTAIALSQAITGYERSLELDEKMAEDGAQPLVSLELLRERGLL